MDGLLPWLRRSGWAYLALACALALVAWRLAGPDDAGQPAAGAGGQTVALAPARGDRARAGARRRIVVHVAGAVRRPGLYALPEGSRVHRALMRAGGARRTADLAALNLAATLNDGQQVVIPARSVAGAAAGAAGAGASAGAPAGPSAGPLSLSQATAEQLEALDGIGPTLAGRIIEWRTRNGGFSSIDQLMEVQGIGPARFESLRAQVVP